jgi:hypothetical protein
MMNGDRRSEKMGLQITRAAPQQMAISTRHGSCERERGEI